MSTHTQYVTTLISCANYALRPSAPVDMAQLVREALTELGHHGQQADWRWLIDGEVADIFHGATNGAWQAWLTDRLAHLSVDVVTQPALHRRKQLLLSDMDSTIIEQECIDELAARLGIKDRVAVITERAMNGEIAFDDALRERVALLRGLPVATLADVFAEQVTLMPGAKRLVATMRAHGAHAVLVSGGFTYFTGRVREAVGFHADHANTLGVEGTALSGSVMPPILDKDSKREILLQLLEERRLKPEQSMALGDGANDIPMLLEAGLGIAFRAKRHVREAAKAQINYHDLTAALLVQGYTPEEFKE